MAKKKGPLTDSEKFYIVKNPDNYTNKQLAEAMGRTEKTIAKIIKEANGPTEVKSTESTTPVHPDGESRMRNLMGRKTGGGRKGVSIMTPGASALADDTRHLRLNKEKPTDRPDRYSDPGITKIFPDED